MGKGSWRGEREGGQAPWLSPAAHVSSPVPSAMAEVRVGHPGKGRKELGTHMGKGSGGRGKGREGRAEVEDGEWGHQVSPVHLKVGEDSVEAAHGVGWWSGGGEVGMDCLEDGGVSDLLVDDPLSEVLDQREEEQVGEGGVGGVVLLVIRWKSPVRV